MSKLEGKQLHDMMRVILVVSQGKFKYIDEEFDGNDLQSLARTFTNMGPIDFNAACWHAQDQGYLSIDKKSAKVELLKTPEEWVFDSTINHLVEVTPYVLSKLAENEVDPEENFYANYVSGYVPLDVMIAVRYMLLKGVITTYEIKDTSEDENGEKVTDTYLFYSLPENAEKRWGEQQFKDQEKLEK
jgi:hypothetical protein